MEIKEMDISAEIKGIKYVPFLCKPLKEYELNHIKYGLPRDGSFKLKVNSSRKICISWWVSSKRTRSYPYTRVYDTLNCSEKKVTIIPIFKDEGKDGDRDYLQWDTISLMSLLGVYVVISYYSQAKKNNRYNDKITEQKFDLNQVELEINRLLNYQSDALHWNLDQIDRIKEISSKALESYEYISKITGVSMHSHEMAQKKINEIIKSRESFMNSSRNLAKQAQAREIVTIQPKEKLAGFKGKITIKNYLGGYYYFTCDEVEIYDNTLYIIEGKHTKSSQLPSWNDIKDGLLKMMLFTNLSNIQVNNKNYNVCPILKLTNAGDFIIKYNQKSLIENLRLLQKEAHENGSKVLINDDDLNSIIKTI